MTMQHGTVKFFNSEKNYGFITFDDGQQEAFFHLNDGHPLRMGRIEPFLVGHENVTRIPREGEGIVFKAKAKKKGPKAYSWGFEDEWLAVLQPNGPRLRPRLRFTRFYTYPDADQALADNTTDFAVVENVNWPHDNDLYCHVMVHGTLVKRLKQIPGMMYLPNADGDFPSFVVDKKSVDDTFDLLAQYFVIKDITNI